MKLRSDPFVHRNFTGGPISYQHDIALLRLRRHMDQDIYTPICLPPPGLDLSKTTATAMGEILATFINYSFPQAGEAENVMKTALPSLKRPEACPSSPARSV